MATLPPDREPGSRDVRIYLNGKTTKKSSLTNGSVQRVACALQPLLQMDAGLGILIDAGKSLLEATFEGKVTVLDLEPVHYEIKYNENENGMCLKCSSLAVFKIKFGTDFVIVNLRESLHYT